MKRMEKAKQKYEDIPIPNELSERIMLEVEKAEKKYNRESTKKGRDLFMKKGITAVMATAAAAIILFTVGVNTNEAFAKEISDIPVLGTIAKVLTFRSYETQTEDLKISVDIPSIELISEELNGVEKDVNEEIYEFCTQYADEAMKRAEEYKKAFLDTGGTEEEWAAHNISIKVWYEVKSQTDEYLSLVIMGADNGHGGNSENREARYYNFDMKAGKWITLKDILGDDYMPSTEQNIRAQIKQREEETGMDYFDEEWKGLDENTKFYVNDIGNPVIVFERYEIAPGALGRQEFEIVK